MSRTGFRAGVASLLGLCLVAAACTGRGDAPTSGGTIQGARSTPAREVPSTGQELSIAFRSEPDPPQAGNNTFEVAVKQPDGSPVTDATVTTVFSMPAMPSMNMPAMRSTATLAHEASGRYRGSGFLSMSGTWNVMVTVSRGPDQLGSKQLSVVVK